MRFDLKFALLVMSNIGVLAWASTVDHLAAWAVFVAIAQLSAASYAASQGASPYHWAAIGGVIGLFALAICLGPLSTIVYLASGRPYQPDDDFFEDGVAFAVIAPFILAVVFSPLFFVIGLACALMVRKFQRVFSYRSNQSAG
jgi:hypothetical protein